MPNRFPIYSRLIRLYPKKYRQQYGDQMLQTLADMLDDHPGRLSKLDIWLHTSLDLPVTVIQQNIIALGDNTMNKKIQNTIKHHKKILITVAAVVVVVMAFVLQGWFRWTVLPEAVQPFYTPSVKNDFNTQRINAYDPVQTLAGKSVKTFASCSTVMLQNIHTQLDCQASQAQDYSKLPTTDSSKQILNESIQKLEAALTEQGYKAGSNGVTLSSLVQGTYQGKDYSPDAYYAKRIGKYTCVFDTMIAYANPQPPAIRTSYQCSRTVNILGTPNTDVGGSGGYESIIQPPAH